MKSALWKPGPNSKAVLDALRMGGPMDDHDVFEQVAGRMTRRSCDRAIDDLAEHGAIVDTGQRGRWTSKGRLIVWRVT